MYRSKLFSTILIIIVSHSCFSQIGKLPIHSFVKNDSIIIKDIHTSSVDLKLFNHSDGLPAGKIQQVVQTNDGYVWLSIWNYGLVRYDGYHFRSFQPTQIDSTSMPATQISKICQSKNGGLWLLTEKGVVWFDLRTYRSKIINNPIKQFSWMDIIEDGIGQLWVYGDGLFLYNQKKQKFQKIISGIDKIKNVQVNLNKALFRTSIFSTSTLARDGSLWLGGSSIFHIDPFSKIVFVYQWNKIIYNEILPDPNNNYLWFSGYDGSISRYDFEDNSWLRIRIAAKMKQKFTSDYYRLSYIQNNNLWMTDNESVAVMDTRSFNIKTLKNDELQVSYNTLVKGRDSILWIYNEHQLFCSFYNTERFIYRKILPDYERVVSYFRDNNNEWFGTFNQSNSKGELYQYNTITNETRAFTIPNQTCKPFCLTRFSNDELLVGVGETSKGNGQLFLFNKETFSFKKVIAPVANSNSLTTDSIEYLNVCQDEKNNFWFSIYKDGLLEYDHNQKQFNMVIQNKKDPPGTDHVIKTSVTNLLYSKDGFIWFGGSNGAFKKVNTANRYIQEFKISPRLEFVNPLTIDRNENVYQNTDSGLALYSPLAKQITFIKSIPLCHTAIIDSNNNFIGLADNGLWFYNSTSKIARRFNGLDGFIEVYSDYSINTINKSQSNEVLINDFYRLNISSLYPSKIISPLAFTSVIVSGKQWRKDSNVNSVDTLILTHDQNQLNFEFAALSFAKHESNKYACMLQGLDTIWQQLGSNNLVSYYNLSPGIYTFIIKTSNRDEVWGKEKKIVITIKPAFWQTALFKILLSLIIIGFIYWLIRNQLNKIYLKNQLEKEKLIQQKREAEFQKRLGDLTLSALRSQINPHFIFNCLNSIKLYTTQNDIAAASEYLGKFTKLIRLVLNNCKSEKISLKEELAVLKLYIEMEAMRFKEKLNYNITIENNVDAEFIEVPPLLLQPYVENAIWHGLMHKENGGQLDIDIKMKDDQDLLISIKDDGVGRVKAMEFKNKTLVQHKSFGMQITSERLALIKKLYKTNTSVNVSDLYNDEGMPIGTLVTIQIEV